MTWTKPCRGLTRIASARWEISDYRGKIAKATSFPRAIYNSLFFLPFPEEYNHRYEYIRSTRSCRYCSSVLPAALPTCLVALVHRLCTCYHCAPPRRSSTSRRKQRTRNRWSVNLRKPLDLIGRSRFETLGAVRNLASIEQERGGVGDSSPSLSSVWVICCVRTSLPTHTTNDAPCGPREGEEEKPESNLVSAGQPRIVEKVISAGLGHTLRDRLRRFSRLM